MKLLKYALVGLASLLLLLSIVAWLGFVHWVGDVVALFVPYFAGERPYLSCYSWLKKWGTAELMVNCEW